MKKLGLVAAGLMVLSLAACGSKSYCDDFAECACADLDGCNIQDMKEACEKSEKAVKETCGKTYDKYMDCFDFSCKDNKLEGEMTGGALKCAVIATEYAACSIEAIAK